MMPPGSGFSPAGSSGGHGVGSFVPNRTRTAVAGLNRYALPAAAPPRLRRLPQRRHVVENPEAAAVRAGDEIRAEARAVVLHLDVAHRDRRHVALAATASDRRRRYDTHTCSVGRRVQQPFLARILANRVRDRAGRDAGVDLRPRLAAVVRAPEVRIHVVEAHRVRRGVRRELVEVAGVDVEDARPRLDRGRRDVRPLRAAVRRHLDDAVVACRPRSRSTSARRRRRAP